MKVLVDTNVVLDFLLDRLPFSETAAALFSQIELGRLNGFLCATTVTTLHYLVSKALGPNQARKDIHRLMTLFDVAPVNRLVLEAALVSPLTDFEDAVLLESARHSGVTNLIIRNAKDFKKAKMSVYSPQEFLAALDEIK